LSRFRGYRIPVVATGYTLSAGSTSTARGMWRSIWQRTVGDVVAFDLTLGNGIVRLPR
jgi:hypothetical protein